MEAIERAKGVGPEGKYLDFARRWQRGLERLRMQRKPYVDPRPERVLRFLRFIERERVPPGLSLLSVPSLVPGWIVQRNRDPANLEPRYDVWFPDDRDARVPWAVGLPSVTLTRDSLMEVLRFRWSKDAGEFLMAAEAAKER